MLSVNLSQENNSDILNFKQYWSDIKGKVSDILTHGNRLYSLRNKYLNLERRAEKVGRDDLAEQARQAKSGTTDLFMNWQEIQRKIVEWLPVWKSEEKEVGISGVGILPWLIVAAMAAIVAVAGYAMKYLTQYQEAQLPYEALENKIATAEEIAGIIPKQEVGIFGRIENVGMLVVLGLGGVLAYSFLKRRK